MKNAKKDCFAYQNKKCIALECEDCTKCSFYQNEIAYEIRLKKHEAELRKHQEYLEEQGY